MRATDPGAAATPQSCVPTRSVPLVRLARRLRDPSGFPGPPTLDQIPRETPVRPIPASTPSPSAASASRRPRPEHHAPASKGSRHVSPRPARTRGFEVPVPFSPGPQCLADSLSLSATRQPHPSVSISRYRFEEERNTLAVPHGALIHIASPNALHTALLTRTARENPDLPLDASVPCLATHRSRIRSLLKRRERDRATLPESIRNTY